MELTVEDSGGEDDEEYTYEDDEYITDEQMQEMRQADQHAQDQDEFHMTVKEIKAKIHVIRERVSKIRSEQDSVYVNYSRDFNLSSSLESLVGFWSLIQMAMVLLTGILQVVVVKGLFEERSCVRKFLFWL